MRFIGKDDVLFEILKKDIKIISSSIIRIDVFKQGFDLIIEVDIKLLYSKDKYIKLRFGGIKEYSFYFNSNHIFYNVESYKLIKDNNLFFISFDPENEMSLSASDNDQDSILCSSFEGYFLDLREQVN